MIEHAMPCRGGSRAVPLSGKWGVLPGLPLIALVVAAVLGLPASARWGHTSDHVTVTFLVTGDEHGWLEPREDPPFTTGGAANLMGRYREVEGYVPGSDGFLLLSAGDMWTGAAISTWFEGEPVVEVFNAMGYRAAAIGNHEFDFGRDVLLQRRDQAGFPLLSANISILGTGEPPDFSTPYLTTTVSGVHVGIVGLTSTNTPWTTHPVNIADLEFGDYEQVLRRVVQELRTGGADVVVVLAHVCVDPLVDLAREVSDLDVPLMVAGHCHELATVREGDTFVVSTGSSLDSYARVDLVLDPATGEVVGSTPSLVYNRYVTGDDNPVTPDPLVEAIVEVWRLRVEAATGEVIGFTASGLPRGSWRQASWVLDSWLDAYPAAELAMTNWGGFRAAVPAGEITVVSVVDVLPFDNTIVDCEVTGAELIANIECCGGAVAGFTYTYREVAGGDREVVSATLADGSPLQLTLHYHVLVNDFMFAGGGGYLFGQQDPDAYPTGIHWRQPVIDWTRAQGSTADSPLDGLLDDRPRAALRPDARRVRGRFPSTGPFQASPKATVR